MTPLPQNKWWSIRRKTSSCHLFMTRFLQILNQSCQRYTISNRSLFVGYCYSLIDYLLIQGVLHHRTFKDEDEIQQLILPQKLCKPILKSLHDDNGHQGQQRMLSLLWDKVYWPSMYANTDHWLSQCERCLISKGDYTEPKT